MESIGEDTPLLDNRPSSTRPTPPPISQISVPLLLHACDALAAQSVLPYIIELVGGLPILGGDKRKIGYYVGLIGTLYGVSVAVSILQWNRVSDHIGRKPVILVGMLGSTISMLCFGLSHTLWGLIASRCLWGLLDGTTGVSKSIVGDITDTTNQANVFGLSFIAWGLGSAVGPFIGGSLANPSERFPDLFNDQFWKANPYFLPCFAIASLLFLTFLFVLVFFKESAPPISYRSIASPDQPLPLRQLLVYPVVISIASYSCLEFLTISHDVVLPLFLAMPIELGGLGLDPVTIGYIITAFRALPILSLWACLGPAVRLLGERRVFILAISTYAGIWPLFPLINTSARTFGIGIVVWSLVGLMVVLMAAMDLAYGCIFVLITAAAPNKHSLGMTNGLSQTAVSIGRIVAPAFAASMLSFSIQHNLLGGFAGYLSLFSLSCLGIFLARLIPGNTEGQKVLILEA